MHSRTTRQNLSGMWFRSVLALCVGALVLITLYIQFGTHLNRRINIAVASAPVMVWSWDTNEKHAYVIRIPESTIVEAAHGYGRYSLQSLWKLDHIDHQNGALFADSVSNALGIPIHGYIGPQSDDVIPVPSGVPYMRSVFSWLTVARLFLGQYRTDMSLSTAIALTSLMSHMKSDAFNTIDFAKRPLTFKEEMPDNTTQDVLDTERVDALLKGKFEDPEIRKEGLSVALYNSTPVPVLASRAARLLASSGILVISVDNTTTTRDRCIIQGSKVVIASETTAEIQRTLLCATHIADMQSGADLVVTIGTEFSKRYIAKQEILH